VGWGGADATAASMVKERINLNLFRQAERVDGSNRRKIFPFGAVMVFVVVAFFEGTPLLFWSTGSCQYEHGY